MSRATSFAGPGADYIPVTPDDARTFEQTVVGLYVERGGAVSFVTRGGETRTVVTSDFGWILCFVTAVRATGTTAAGIHAVTVG
jgi:hypothetical protein